MTKIFKKPFKPANAHSVSNKDKKKLRERLACYGEQIIDFLLQDDDENGLQLIKVSGSKVVIYQKGDTPYLFASEDKTQAPLMPSLYLMFVEQRLPVGA